MTNKPDIRITVDGPTKEEDLVLHSKGNGVVEVALKGEKTRVRADHLEIAAHHASLAEYPD